MTQIRKAIRTTYRGPSDKQGSRMLAADMDRKRVSIPYDSGHTLDENHRRAMLAFVAKMGWSGDYVGGAQSADVVYWVSDDGRLAALKGVVNSMRAGTWSGSPWGRDEFKAAASAIGHSVPWHGNPLDAPTKYEELEAFMHDYNEARK